MIHEKESQLITWIKFPLILSVIFLHINSKSAELTLLALPAVPCFFFISGFLFFINIKSFGKAEYVMQLRKRILSLLIPYLLWNLLSVIAHYIYSYVIDKPIWREQILSPIILQWFWCNNRWNINATNVLGWNIYGSGPVNYSLWYIRDLMVLALLSYLIYLLISRFKYISLFFFFVIYITQIWIPLPGFSATSLFFFALGSWFAIYRHSILFRSERLNVFIIVVSFVLFFITLHTLHWHEGHNIFQLCLILTLTFSYFCLSSLLMNIHPLEFISRLSKISLFVYFSHAIFSISFCGSLLMYILPENSMGEILNWFLLPFVIFLANSSVYFLLKAIYPKGLSLLLGNR